MTYSFPTAAHLMITQRWGNVNSAMYPAPSYRHMGLDIGGPVGSPIYAAADGTVETVSMVNRHGYGRHVIIQHDGYETVYAHLHKMFVLPGVGVMAEELIGEMGGQPGDDDPIDGASTGSHLHFEVILPNQPFCDYVRTWAGWTVDPLLYLTRLAFGDPRLTVTVVAGKGVRVRKEPNIMALQIGSLGSRTVHPIIGLVDVGTSQWAQLWSLRPEYAAVRYGGERLMDVSAGTVVVTPPPITPPATLDEKAIRLDEIQRLMAFLENRKSEL